MRTASKRSRYQRLDIRFALALPFGLVGCLHTTVTAKAPVGSVNNPCVSMDAVRKGAVGTSCTLAQRICLVAGDIPVITGKPEFLPTASYNAHWQSHVTAWLAQLTEIAKEPALEVYALGVHKKLALVNASEHDRRLIVENGELLYTVKLLGQKAKTADPPIAISCPLPE